MVKLSIGTIGLICTLITTVVATTNFIGIDSYAQLSQSVHDVTYAILDQLQKNNVVDAPYVKNLYATFYDGPITSEGYRKAKEVKKLMGYPNASKKEYMQVRDILELNLRSDPDNVNLNSDYCSIHIYLESNDDATSCFRSLYKKYPEIPSIQIGYILSLNNIHDYKDALDIIEKGNLENSDNPELLNIIAIIKANDSTGNGKSSIYDAKEIYTNLIRKHPEEQYLWANNGWVEMKLKSYDKCIESIEIAQQKKTDQKNRWMDSNLQLCKKLYNGDPYTKIQEYLAGYQVFQVARL